MQQSTINRLVQLNNDFYNQVSLTFDATRQSAWPGWYELLSILTPYSPLTTIDLGCGNGRFFKFISDHKLNISQGYGYDNASSLIDIAAKNTSEVFQYHQVNMFSDLPQIPFLLPQANVITSFGVWHHIPGKSNRKELLNQLIQKVSKPGIVILSLWHASDKHTVSIPDYLDNQISHDLESGDQFIGWQNTPEAVRYCHRFDESDIQDLMSVPASTVGRFESDGKDYHSNTYLYYMVQ